MVATSAAACQDIESALRDDVAAEALELPVLPEVAQQVMAATAAPDPDLRQLAELLRRDATMAAHVLRLANSPMFRGREPIVTLQQATTRLGASRLREVAIVAACEARVFTAPGFDDEVRAVLRRSLATALCAQELARQLRFNVEEAFLVGLLHDVGWPVLLARAAALVERGRAIGGRQEVLRAAELWHAHAGAQLCRRWELPDKLAAVLRHHHDDDPPPAVAPLVHLVELGGELARTLLDANAAGDDVGAIADHPSVVALNLYDDALEAVLAKRDAILRTLGALC